LRAIGHVLFSTASPEFRRSLGLPSPLAPAGEEQTDIDPEIVRHAVAVMLDDLHVHRLRALWRTMQRTTSDSRQAASVWLYDTGPLPGEPEFPQAAAEAKARSPRPDGEAASTDAKPANGTSAGLVAPVKELDEV
jgi:hypothetical protein